MADIRTFWIDGTGQWQASGAALAEDDGLETAVIISLFTDRRAADDDVLPDQASADRRGWWGDAYAEVSGDQIGSRLWLLRREKQTPQVLERARQYAAEALQWLVDDGVARAVDVTAEWLNAGAMGLVIEIARAGAPVARFRFDSFWKGQ